MNEDEIVVKTTDKSDWPVSERELWRRIAAHSFEIPDHSLTFAARLARDHGWTIDHARRAIEEYRRFCFLAVTGEDQATPSEEIDAVWHQHLTYSRDYWQDWCGKALERPLHHQPTQGGPNESARFARQYAETLARYEACFGPPDPAFWPGPADRFVGARFRVVDLDRTIVVAVPASIGRAARRLAGLLGCVAFAAAPMASKPAEAAGLGPLDWAARDTLTFYAALTVAALIAAVIYRLVVMQAFGGSNVAARSFGPVELALMAGGRERGADVLALELMRAGHLRVVGDRIEVLPRPPFSGPSDADILRRHGLSFTRARLVELLEPSLRPAWDRLARDGYALSALDAAAIRTRTFLLFAPVLMLGLAKVAIGFARGKPVGILIVMIVLSAMAALIASSVRRLATGAGLRALADMRENHARALRAPLPAEVVTAFSVIGPAALVGTALAPYADLLPKSDGGSGCGGGGDGGGCGGGCGGCGGA